MKATATKHDYLPSEANITATGKGGMAVSDDEIPAEFFMAMASGNPVKKNLNLQYGIPLEDEGTASLKLYDPSGRLVRTLLSENKTAGYYDFSWEPDLPTGLYFLRMSVIDKALTEKIILR